MYIVLLQHFKFALLQGLLSALILCMCTRVNVYQYSGKLYLFSQVDLLLDGLHIIQALLECCVRI